MGSTPEIILSGQEKNWHTVALAGTMPMQGEMMPDNWSNKNKEEQALVAEYIRKTLKKFGSKIDEQGPYTARAGQLVHLKTDFRFLLKNTKSLGNLLKELHPTPAICGLPKEDAYRFIAENEGYERKYYSGFIGWLEPDGQTDLYVNLRCMEILEGEAKLYAGGGILASSEMVSELEETKEKMKTMINIL
jgi:isochorismate synthase